MIWEPFILALAFGLLVSLGLHFIFIWPAQEPPDDIDEPHRDGE